MTFRPKGVSWVTNGSFDLSWLQCFGVCFKYLEVGATTCKSVKLYKRFIHLFSLVEIVFLLFLFGTKLLQQHIFGRGSFF